MLTENTPLVQSRSHLGKRKVILKSASWEGIWIGSPGGYVYSFNAPHLEGEIGKFIMSDSEQKNPIISPANSKKHIQIIVRFATPCFCKVEEAMIAMQHLSASVNEWLTSNSASSATLKTKKMHNILLGTTTSKKMKNIKDLNCQLGTPNFGRYSKHKFLLDAFGSIIFSHS